MSVLDAGLAEQYRSERSSAATTVNGPNRKAPISFLIPHHSDFPTNACLVRERPFQRRKNGRTYMIVVRYYPDWCEKIVDRKPQGSR